MGDEVLAVQPYIFEGSEVRVVGTPDEPRFVVADVCRVLELGNVTEATRGLDEDERGSVILNTPGGPQPTLTVTEPGLYALLSRSRKPAARRFDRWVRHEVLPSIRRTGAFNGDHADLSPMDELNAFAQTIIRPIIQKLDSVAQEDTLRGVGANVLDIKTGLAVVQDMASSLVKRKPFSEENQLLYRLCILQFYGGYDPVDRKTRIVDDSGNALPGLHYEHWVSPANNQRDAGWAVCDATNRLLREAGSLKRQQYRSAFDEFHRLLAKVKVPKVEDPPNQLVLWKP